MCSLQKPYFNKKAADLGRSAAYNNNLILTKITKICLWPESLVQFPQTNHGGHRQ